MCLFKKCAYFKNVPISKISLFKNEPISKIGLFRKRDVFFKRHNYWKRTIQFCKTSCNLFKKQKPGQ